MNYIRIATFELQRTYISYQRIYDLYIIPGSKFYRFMSAAKICRISSTLYVLCTYFYMSISMYKWTRNVYFLLVLFISKHNIRKMYLGADFTIYVSIQINLQSSSMIL